MGAARDNRDDDAPPPYRAVGPMVDLDAPISFSVAKHRESHDWKKRTATRRWLVESLTRLQVGKKSEGSVWAPAVFAGGQRKAALARIIAVLTWDSDAGHTADELAGKIEAIGWYAAIIPSSSWGSTLSEVSADAYERWAADVRGQEGGQADVGAERYLVEQLHKVGRVADGAVFEGSFAVQERDATGRPVLRRLLRIRHNPCPKYRIVAFLKQCFDVSTPAGRRAWKRLYDAACDVIGLPLDRTSGSVERLLYQSRLPADAIDDAKLDIRIVEGTYVDPDTLPEPLPRKHTRRGPASFRDEAVHGRGADGAEDLEYRWVDPGTGDEVDLRKWAVAAMAHLPLADILVERGWPLDERGEHDGKVHVECPFQDQHTSLAGGGTYVTNAHDFDRTGTVDRRAGAIVHCSHNACRDRDRLEFIAEWLRKGALTTTHLYAARDAAKAAQLAADFDPIEDDADLGAKPPIRPSFEWNRADVEAHLPQLKRLAREDRETYEAYREGWDIAGTVPADELDLLIDVADEEPERLDPKPKDTVGWRTRLVRSEKGQPNTGTKNLLLALEHGLGLTGDVIGYNLLKGRIEIRDPGKLPWGHQGEAKRAWADRDDTLAAALAEDELGGVVKPHSIAPIVEAIAWKHAFHPVRDYLHSLVWDGVPRLDRLLVDFAQVEDTPYARAVTARSLIAAVARAFRPGCKVDTALILESTQGFKKSSLFAALAIDPEWFGDNLPGQLGDKSVAEVIGTHWFIEMGELSNLKKAEVDRTKAFMSRAADTYRPAYGRRVVDHPRQCVLTGTVNGEVTGYLRDLTGNRRFWVLRVGPINLAAIVKLRDQLWAEAVARFRAGERWWFDDAEDAHLVEAQKAEADARTEEPEMADMLRRFLTHRPGDSGYDQDHMHAWTKRQAPITVIPTLASFFSAIGVPTRNIGFQQKVAFKQALQALGWVVKQAKVRGVSPIGLERGVRFYAHPDIEKATSVNKWLKVQANRGSVAGIPARDADSNVILLDDHKDRKR